MTQTQVCQDQRLSGKVQGEQQRRNRAFLPPFPKPFHTFPFPPQGPQEVPPSLQNCPKVKLLGEKWRGCVWGLGDVSGLPGRSLSSPVLTQSCYNCSSQHNVEAQNVSLRVRGLYMKSITLSRDHSFLIDIAFGTPNTGYKTRGLWTLIRDKK